MAKEATQVSTKIDPQTSRVLSALIIGGMASVLDTTIVTIALHTLVTELHSSLAVIQWVSTGYLLAFASAIPLVGWAASRFGSKRTWMVALTIFGVGSVLCSLAWSDASLIVFRVLQGLGGGLIFPLMQTIAMQSAHGQSIARVTARMSVPIALGPVLGPVLGGAILAWADWRWLFLINAPIVIVGLILAWRRLSKDPPAAEHARLDVVGFVLLAPALVALLFGLSRIEGGSGVASPLVWGSVTLGVILLVCFVFWSRYRGTSALVRLSLLRSRLIAVPSIGLFLYGGSMYAAMFLLPLYWQTLRGDTVLQAALLLVPQGIGSLAARGPVGALTERYGARTVAGVALVLVLAGTLPFVFADEHTNVWLLGVALFIRGVGLGTMMVPTTSTAYSSVSGDDVAQAAMLTRIFQQLGGSFITAILAVVLAQGIAAGTTDGAFHAAFMVLTGVVVLAFVVAMLLPGKPHPAALDVRTQHTPV